MGKDAFLQAYFCEDEGVDEAQTEEKEHCLHTAQMRTHTDLSEFEELKYAGTETNAAESAVESEMDLISLAPPRPTLQRQSVLDEADLKTRPSRDSILVSAQTETEDERPKARRWAIPSETRMGGVESHLRYVREKPKRRGLFRLF